MRWLVVGALVGACGQPRPPVAPDHVAPTKPPAALPAAPTSDAYGTAHPTFVRDFDRTSARWMALCQVRTDTNGDGKVGVHVGHHGELFGDDAHLYLVIGGGAGTRVDNLVDTSLDHRWLVVVRGGALELIDTHARAVFELQHADVEDDERPGTAHRAARFATNGSVLYVRHRDKVDSLVIHDLATHTEREAVVPDRLWRFGLADDIAEIYTVARDQGFPRLNTTLDAGECTGPPASWSSYGQDGPQPTERYIDLARGIEVKQPAQPPADRPRVIPKRVPNVDDGDDGPARWQDATTR